MGPLPRTRGATGWVVTVVTSPAEVLHANSRCAAKKSAANDFFRASRKLARATSTVEANEASKNSRGGGRQVRAFQFPMCADQVATAYVGSPYGESEDSPWRN